jgi:hypothetical protein
MKNIVSILVAVFILAACKNSSTSTPSAAVTTFLEITKKGDIAGLKKIVTKSDIGILEFGEAAADAFSGGKEMIDKMKKEFIAKSENVSYKILSEKIDGNTAEVSVEIKQNEKTSTQPFKLLKEDGAWKVSLTSTGMGGDSKGMPDLSNINLKDSLSKALQEFSKLNIADSISNALNGLNKDSINREVERSMQKIKEVMEKNPAEVKKIEEALKKASNN